MKKFALAIGLVLALSVSALAASVTLSGTLTFEGDYYAADYTDNPTYSSTAVQSTYAQGHTIWSKAPEAKFVFATSGDNYSFSLGATASNKIYNGFVSGESKVWVAETTVAEHYAIDQDPESTTYGQLILIPAVTTPAHWAYTTAATADSTMSVSLAVQNAYIKGGVLGLPGTFTLGQKYTDGTPATTDRGLWWTGTFGNLSANAAYFVEQANCYSADATLKLNASNNVKVAYTSSKGKLKTGAVPGDSSLIEATLTLGKASFKGSVFSTPVGGDLTKKSGPYYAATVSALALGPVVIDAYAKYWSADFDFRDAYYGTDGLSGHNTVAAGMANEASYVKATYNLNKDATSYVSGKYWLDSDYEVSATLASVIGFKVVGTYGSYTVDATDNYDRNAGEVQTQWSVSAEKVYNNVTYKAAYAQTGKLAVTAVYKF